MSKYLNKKNDFNRKRISFRNDKKRKELDLKIDDDELNLLDGEDFDINSYIKPRKIKPVANISNVVDLMTVVGQKKIDFLKDDELINRKENVIRKVKNQTNNDEIENLKENLNDITNSNIPIDEKKVEYMEVIEEIKMENDKILTQEKIKKNEEYINETIENKNLNSIVQNNVNTIANNALVTDIKTANDLQKNLINDLKSNINEYNFFDDVKKSSLGNIDKLDSISVITGSTMGSIKDIGPKDSKEVNPLNESKPGNSIKEDIKKEDNKEDKKINETRLKRLDELETNERNRRYLKEKYGKPDDYYNIDNINKQIFDQSNLQSYAQNRKFDDNISTAIAYGIQGIVPGLAGANILAQNAIKIGTDEAMKYWKKDEIAFNTGVHSVAQANMLKTEESIEEQDKKNKEFVKSGLKLLLGVGGIAYVGSWLTGGATGGALIGLMKAVMTGGVGNFFPS